MRVYVTGYWEKDESLFQTIIKYGFGEAKWKNIEFTTGEDFDRVVVLNGPNSHSLDFDYSKAIVFRLEPPASSNYLSTSTGFLVPGYLHWPFWHKMTLPAACNLASTNLIKKTRLFSTVTSDLSYMTGHIERLILIHLLDQTLLNYFDVWGRNTSTGYFDLLKSYRGELRNKYDGLLKYKYHLAIENSFLPDYFTEKITDPLIAECFCLYSGCSNIEEYIDPRAFCRIDLSDKESAIESIIQVLQDKVWEKSIKYIKQQKIRVLTDLNPLNLIWLAANELDYAHKLKL